MKHLLKPTIIAGRFTENERTRLGPKISIPLMERVIRDAEIEKYARLAYRIESRIVVFLINRNPKS